MAFDEYVRARSPALMRTALLLTTNRETAEDLLQTVLTKALLRWTDVATADDIDAYLRKALLRTWISWRRRHWHREQPSALPLGHGSTSSSDEVDERLVTLDALRTLPPRMRAAVVLRYYDDLSERETAELLGCSVGAIKSQTAKGLAKLRVLLAAPDSSPTAPRLAQDQA